MFSMGSYQYKNQVNKEFFCEPVLELGQVNLF